jgi:hypothetical protein
VGPPGSKSLPETAKRVVAEAQAALVGWERDGVRVDGLLQYGAVDIDPGHLVVWILLSGKPDDQLPEWLKIEAADAEASNSSLIDVEWLSHLRAEIVRRFSEVGWPAADRISVYADSANRVDNGGGWTYFKNG